MSIEQRPTFAVPEHEVVLQQACGDPSGWQAVEQPSNNAVYLNESEVVRVARTKENRSLVYEAAIASAIPCETGYPGISASGVTEDFAWVKMPRVEGSSLAQAWPGLTVSERETALNGCAKILAYVHALNAEKLQGAAWEDRPPYPSPPFNSDIFGDLSPARFTGQLEHLARHEWISPAFREAAAEGYEEYRLSAGVPDCVTGEAFSVAAFPDAVPVHGDASPHNFLANDKTVTTLLDFELACRAPADLDIFRLAHWPDAVAEPSDKETTALLLDFLSQYDALALSRMRLYNLVRWVGLADGWLYERQRGSTYQPQVTSEPVVTKMWQELRGEGVFAKAAPRTP